MAEYYVVVVNDYAEARSVTPVESWDEGTDLMQQYIEKGILGFREPQTLRESEIAKIKATGNFTYDRSEYEPAGIQLIASDN